MDPGHELSGGEGRDAGGNRVPGTEDKGEKRTMGNL